MSNHDDGPTSVTARPRIQILAVDLGTPDADVTAIGWNDLRLYILRELDDCRCASCAHSRHLFMRSDRLHVLQHSLLNLCRHGHRTLAANAIDLLDRAGLTA